MLGRQGRGQVRVVQNRTALIQRNDVGIRQFLFPVFRGGEVGQMDGIFAFAGPERRHCRTVRQGALVVGHPHAGNFIGRFGEAVEVHAVSQALRVQRHAPVLQPRVDFPQIGRPATHRDMLLCFARGARHLYLELG